MARWTDVEIAAPDLARRVEGRFKAHKHALLATLRTNGYPRITGVETQWVGGDLWMGMMHRSLKARDLLRDPRMALHSAPDGPEVDRGDARITGRAEAVTDEERMAAWDATLEQRPPGPFHLFRVEIVEVSIVRAVVDHLEIGVWTESGGLRTLERR